MTSAGNPVTLAGRHLDLSRREGWGRRQPVLHDVSVTLWRGEVVALLGPNGAGKSTLLRVLTGLVQPDAGALCLEGRPLAQWTRRQRAVRIAYVPQLHEPPFPYTVREVVALGTLPHEGGSGRAQAKTRVEEALARLGLETLAARPYTRISGGERQRTLIARALVQGAATLLMDEPASGLDWGHQRRLAVHLRALADAGHAVLMSTHQPEQLTGLADRVLLMRGGRLIAEGPPPALLNPAVLEALYGLEGGEAPPQPRTATMTE